MPGMKKVCSVAHPPIHLIPLTDFLDVLRGWGQTWIWDDLTVCPKRELRANLRDSCEGRMA